VIERKTRIPWVEDEAEDEGNHQAVNAVRVRARAARVDRKLPDRAAIASAPNAGAGYPTRLGNPVTTSNARAAAPP